MRGLDSILDVFISWRSREKTIHGKTPHSFVFTGSNIIDGCFFDNSIDFIGEKEGNFIKVLIVVHPKVNHSHMFFFTR